MKWVKKLHCMYVVCSLNYPMITGNCDPQKSRALRERKYQESKENIKQSSYKKKLEKAF